MAEKTKSVYDVSRSSFDPTEAAQVAESLGIVTEATDLEIKNEAGKVIKTVAFRKVLFEEPIGADDTPEERLARRLAFFEELQPAVSKDGVVVRLNSPLDIDAVHVTSSLDLAMRNGIRSKEKIALEGPSNSILASAKKLAAYKNISLDEAVALVKVAWGVE